MARGGRNSSISVLHLKSGRKKAVITEVDVQLRGHPTTNVSYDEKMLEFKQMQLCFEQSETSWIDSTGHWQKTFLALDITTKTTGFIEN